MRAEFFGVSEIAHLSTSFSRTHPHALWKTCVPTIEAMRKLASTRHDAFVVNEIGHLSTSFACVHPHWLWKSVRKFQRRASLLVIPAQAGGACSTAKLVIQ
jgi:hypothetical protein